MAVKENSSKETREKERAMTQTVKSKSPEKNLKIKLVRSLIGRPKKQREVVKGLGLRRINSEVIRKDCPEIRGMVNKIHHLIDVEVLEKR